jgi:hypothetical protein
MTRVYSLLALLLSWLIVASLFSGGCNSSNPERARPADDSESGETSSENPSSSDSGIADAIRNQVDRSGPVEVRDVQLPDDLHELMALLARKQAEQMRSPDAAEFLEIQKFRAAASRKLLEMEINDAQLEEFVRVHLDALLHLVRLGDPQAEHDFQKFLARYQEHRKTEVREAVNVAGLIHDFRREMNRPEPDPGPIVETAAEIAREYPDSFEVCRELGSLVTQLLQADQREAANQLAWALLDVYQNSPDRAAREFVKRLQGQMRIAAANLDLVVREIRDGRTDALDRYREAVGFLFSDADLDRAAAEPVVASLQWLERAGMNEAILEANEIVDDASSRISDPQIRNEIRQNCALRSTRLGWQGQPFSISGQAPDGTAFDWPGFSTNRPVVVVFWSASEPTSLRLVQQLAGLPELQQPAGPTLLAASTSGDADAASRLTDQLPHVAIVSCERDASGQDSPWIDRFGIEQLPQLLLVDRSGLVVEINPPPNALRTRIEELAGN